MMTTNLTHPLPVGTRVNHCGRQFSTEPCATVLEVKPQRDGTFEYRVAIDEDNGWVPGGRESWWSSYRITEHTHGRSTA